ncbi:hypothetical protein D3C79_1079430 [compost metagenome]
MVVGVIDALALGLGMMVWDTLHVGLQVKRYVVGALIEIAVRFGVVVQDVFGHG